MKLTLIDNPGEDQWSEFRENCLLGPGDMNHLNAYPYAGMRPTAEQLYHSLRADRCMVWLIEAEGRIVGFFNFGTVIPHHPDAFGVGIGRQFAGRGYATAALREFIGRREELGIAEFHGYCHPDNAAMLRVMEACGLVQQPFQDPHPAVKFSLEKVTD